LTCGCWPHVRWASVTRTEIRNSWDDNQSAPTSQRWSSLSATRHNGILVEFREKSTNNVVARSEAQWSAPRARVGIVGNEVRLGRTGVALHGIDTIRDEIRALLRNHLITLDITYPTVLKGNCVAFDDPIFTPITLLS